MSIRHFIRTNKVGVKEVSLTPIRAIRLFCTECMGWNYSEVEKCPDTLCPLYPYRMRKNPSITRDKTKIKPSLEGGLQAVNQ
jgi:hypothetical protein